jgi:hypothetical protein
VAGRTKAKNKKVTVQDPIRPAPYDGELVWVQIPKHIHEALETRRKAQNNDFTTDEQIAVACEIAYFKDCGSEWWERRVKFAESRLREYKAQEEQLEFLTATIDHERLSQLRSKRRQLNKLIKEDASKTK